MTVMLKMPSRMLDMSMLNNDVNGFTMCCYSFK